MVLTDALRASLRELISKPLQPAISAEHAQTLIDMGLASRWADVLAVHSLDDGRRILVKASPSVH
ncbi:MAG: hypothetical protein JWN13_6906 [Betaproteobacteria bacterium]|jgi:hypothetical protein|nr:hypothetical protein [Betaproteobacteria bacterium]